jgi:hypothetical protein
MAQVVVGGSFFAIGGASFFRASFFPIAGGGFFRAGIFRSESKTAAYRSLPMLELSL